MATVLLGLFSALVWGGGDFGGGLLSRRTPVFGVVLVSQVVGMSIALLLALVVGETLLVTEDVGWSVVAAVAGGVGITALYHGLSVGRMGVVAPITGVLAALIPVGAGILLEGVPGTLVVAGIVLAIAAVVLVSRVPDDGTHAGPSGMRFALIGGVGLGAFSICLAQISDGHAFGALALIRGLEGVMLAAVILVTRSRWRAKRELLPSMTAVGALDMAGNASFVLAVQAGSLAVAAVLSSLYPVTTVILASVFLRERVTPSHAIGIGLAAAAIACIGLGSAG
ncbi:MAG: EamA family transporter [Chloroflexota bacterium]